MSSLTLEGCFQHNWKQADISRYHLLETYKKTHPKHGCVFLYYRERIMPPSTRCAVPLMADAASDARNTIVLATSSAVAYR